MKKTSRAQFITKLHTMLTKENGTIIRWTADGTAFLILKPLLFACNLLPKYCGHKTFTSFERQMNFYRYTPHPCIVLPLALSYFPLN